MTLEEFIAEKRKRNEDELKSFREHWEGMTLEEQKKWSDPTNGTSLPINFMDWNYLMKTWID